MDLVSMHHGCISIASFMHETAVHITGIAAEMEVRLLHELTPDAPPLKTFVQQLHLVHRAGVDAESPHKASNTAEPSTHKVREDVADWGRTGEHSADEEASSGDEARSMSSGLSHRDRAWGTGRKGGPRTRPFTPDDAMATLVHTTKTYIESQKLRRCALCPEILGQLALGNGDLCMYRMKEYQAFLPTAVTIVLARAIRLSFNSSKFL
jgi:hypothetical protein